MEVESLKKKLQMIPKRLVWTYETHPTPQWKGTLPEIPCVHFILEVHGDNKYRLQSSLPGIRPLVVRELTYAKFFAQEQFNGFVLHLFQEASNATNPNQDKPLLCR